MFFKRLYQACIITLWLGWGCCCSVLATPPMTDEEPVAETTAPIGNDSLPNSQRLSDAIAGGYRILLEGAKNYPQHRDCFSCHHQTLPLMALSLEGRSDPAQDQRAFYQQPTTKAILDFTEKSFDGKREAMREGNGVGGRSLTVAYGLWAMDLAGAERNGTTDAMVEYLLKTQAKDGAWSFQSLRPPAASSRAMTSAIAVYGLRAYGPEAIDPQRMLAAYKQVFDWSLSVEEWAEHEELVGLVLLDDALGKELSGYEDAALRSKLKEWSSIQKRRIADLWTRQREDGGWAQNAGLASDAYATGQALLVLKQVDALGGQAFLSDGTTFSEKNEKYLQAIHFLLDTQKADGSWHVATRSKPVQVYFDNGDPHGKDQFISMMATGWATAALADYQASGRAPLEPTRVRQGRLGREGQSEDNTQE
jgi:N-acyl-D-amino-acid deacylase